MVRAAALGLLLIAGAAQAQDEPIPTLAWISSSYGDSTFWVIQEEIEPAYGRGLYIWVHGDHTRDARVSHSWSITRYHFTCDGRYATIAYTSYSRDGSTLENYDQPASFTAVRPNSLASEIAERFCGMKP